MKLSTVAQKDTHTDLENLFCNQASQLEVTSIPKPVFFFKRPGLKTELNWKIKCNLSGLCVILCYILPCNCLYSKTAFSLKLAKFFGLFICLFVSFPACSCKFIPLLVYCFCLLVCWRGCQQLLRKIHTQTLEVCFATMQASRLEVASIPRPVFCLFQTTRPSDKAKLEYQTKASSLLSDSLLYTPRWRIAAAPTQSRVQYGRQGRTSMKNSCPQTGQTWRCTL